MSMRRLVCAVAALALAGAAAAAGGAPAPDAKQVNAQGCVKAGVEASCLMVKDVDSGKLYNLLIKGDKPAIGIGIEFTGVPYDGVTVCMQGAPVQVTKWVRKDSLKCRRSNVE
jgi:opacity protein-like surface antigen